MARQDIDVDKRGNDGTGDTIREAFKKINANFNDLYAAFGVSGAISSSNLSDFPASYANNQMFITNATGNKVLAKNIIGGGGISVDLTNADIIISSTLSTNLNSEITRSSAADTTLTTNLNSEITRAENVESTLQSNINYEITRTTNAEFTLTANIDNEITRASNAEFTLTANIDNEITRASNAEFTLTANLDNEITRASNAEFTLTANLDNEITRASNAEFTLTANLDSEITRAENVESTLQSNINYEITRATNVESTLTISTSGMLDISSRGETSLSMSILSTPLPSIISDDYSLGRTLVLSNPILNSGASHVIANRNITQSIIVLDYTDTAFTTILPKSAIRIACDGFNWYLL